MKKLVLIVLFVLASSRGTSAWPSEREEEELSASLTNYDRNVLVRGIIEYNKNLYLNGNQFAVLCLVPEVPYKEQGYTYKTLNRNGLCAYSRPRNKDAPNHAERVVLEKLSGIKKIYTSQTKLDKRYGYSILMYTYLIPCGGCKGPIAWKSYGDPEQVHVVYTKLYPTDNKNEANKNYEQVKQLFYVHRINLSQYTY